MDGGFFLGRRSGGNGEPFVNRCFNPTDPITLEEWTAASAKEDVITILQDPTERKSAEQGQCYERSSLIYALEQSKIWHWIPTNPEQPLYGRADPNIRYYKLPLTNQWITESALKSLRNPEFKVFQLEKLGRDLIGSEFGISRIHGALTIIYDVRALAADWDKWKAMRAQSDWLKQMNSLEIMRLAKIKQWNAVMINLQIVERKEPVAVSDVKMMPQQVIQIPAPNPEILYDFKERVQRQIVRSRRRAPALLASFQLSADLRRGLDREEENRRYGKSPPEPRSPPSTEAARFGRPRRDWP